MRLLAFISRNRISLSFLMLAVVLVSAGCEGPETNPRPWNSPESLHGGGAGMVTHSH
jgi:hypothetical protein